VFAFDMHVHTCLSPCGELDMHPAAIVREAVAQGIDGVAICDHNAADNVAAVARAACAAGCLAVPGMEITTEEEVHVVALLPDVASAGALHARVAAALPGLNASGTFGEQVIANEDAQVLGFNSSLLSGATSWSLERTVDEIHRVGGLAVAAHIDRERFGMIGQLGFVPPGLALDAVEVSSRTPYNLARVRFGDPLGLSVLTGSDAHALSALGQALTFLRLDGIDAREVAMAVRGEGGRAVLGGGRPMEDLALHLLDIAQNGIEAGATRIAIDVTEDSGADLLTIRIADNGRGMDEATIARAVDPFFTTRTTRRVGLGLPLLKHAAEAAGGGLTIRSAVGEGTEIAATFRLGHVDRAPLGDIETTVVVLAVSRPDVDLGFSHRRGEAGYQLSTAAIRRACDGAPAASPDVLTAIRGAVRAGEASLSGRVASVE
jgi:hypothetical protein